MLIIYQRTKLVNLSGNFSLHKNNPRFQGLEFGGLPHECEFRGSCLAGIGLPISLVVAINALIYKNVEIYRFAKGNVASKLQADNLSRCVLVSVVPPFVFYSIN